MRKILAVACTATMLSIPLAGVAGADAGGVPDDSAAGELTGDANGRKGNCFVPGDFFSVSAKLVGPNNAPPGSLGLTPGQGVSTFCTAGGDDSNEVGTSR